MLHDRNQVYNTTNIQKKFLALSKKYVLPKKFAMPFSHQPNLIYEIHLKNIPTIGFKILFLKDPVDCSFYKTMRSHKQQPSLKKFKNSNYNFLSYKNIRYKKR